MIIWKLLKSRKIGILFDNEHEVNQRVRQGSSINAFIFAIYLVDITKLGT